MMDIRRQTITWIIGDLLSIGQVFTTIFYNALDFCRIMKYGNTVLKKNISPFCSVFKILKFDNLLTE